MKWFKHETDSSESEKIRSLISEHGFAGLGRFWTIMELVAKKMDVSNRCHIEYPVMDWCSILKLKRPKLSCFLVTLEKQLNFKVEQTDSFIKITIPNLLKKRDNYSKDLQASQKKLPRKEVDVDKDKDLETHTNKNPVCADLNFSDWDLETAKLFRNDIVNSKPDYLFVTPINSDAETICLMRETDKRTKENIRSVWAKARAHEFWSTRIRGPDSLRKQFDGLEMQFERNPAATESTSDAWLRKSKEEPQTNGAMNGET